MVKRKKYPALLVVIAVLGGLLSVWTVPVGAVESYGIGAIPAHPREDNTRTKSIFVYEAKTGTVITDAVKLINNTSEKHTIRIYGVDSQHSSDGAFACAQAVDKKEEVGSWLSLQQNEVTLEANTNKEIPFTVTVPKTAGTGEHNGCIAIEDAKAPTQRMGNGIMLSFRSALRVAVTVPGKIEANLAFTNLVVDSQGDKLLVSPVLKNTGNVSVDASIRLSLVSVFGTVVAHSEGTFVVLNKDESRFNFELGKPFWGGWYTLETEAEYSILRSDPHDAGQSRITHGKARSLFIAPQPAASLLYSVGALVIVGSSSYLLWRRRQYKLMHQSTINHIIKPGDNLQTLAEHAAINWRTLVKLNKLRPPYYLQPGQTIRIPKARQTQSNKSSKKPV